MQQSCAVPCCAALKYKKIRFHNLCCFIFRFLGKLRDQIFESPGVLLSTCGSSWTQSVTPPRFLEKMGLSRHPRAHVLTLFAPSALPGTTTSVKKLVSKPPGLEPEIRSGFATDLEWPRTVNTFVSCCRAVKNADSSKPGIRRLLGYLLGRMLGQI